MTQRSKSAGIEPNVSRNEIFRAFGSALRLYIGRGKRHSYKDIERGAGVPARMIEAYRYDPSHEEWREPGVDHILSIAGFIGPDFTNEILPLIGQGSFWLPEDGDPNPGTFAADSSEDATEIVKRASDGVFCDNDRRELGRVGQRKIERGMRLVAMARSA